MSIYGGFAQRQQETYYNKSVFKALETLGQFITGLKSARGKEFDEVRQLRRLMKLYKALKQMEKQKHLDPFFSRAFYPLFEIFKAAQLSGHFLGLSDSNSEYFTMLQPINEKEENIHLAEDDIQLPSPAKKQPVSSFQHYSNQEITREQVSRNHGQQKTNSNPYKDKEMAKTQLSPQSKLPLSPSAFNVSFDATKKPERPFSTAQNQRRNFTTANSQNFPHRKSNLNKSMIASSGRKWIQQLALAQAEQTNDWVSLESVPQQQPNQRYIVQAKKDGIMPVNQSGAQRSIQNTQTKLIERFKMNQKSFVPMRDSKRFRDQKEKLHDIYRNVPPEPSLIQNNGKVNKIMINFNEFYVECRGPEMKEERFLEVSDDFILAQDAPDTNALNTFQPTLKQGLDQSRAESKESFKPLKSSFMTIQQDEPQTSQRKSQKRYFDTSKQLQMYQKRHGPTLSQDAKIVGRASEPSSLRTSAQKAYFKKPSFPRDQVKQAINMQRMKRSSQDIGQKECTCE